LGETRCTRAACNRLLDVKVSFLSMFYTRVFCTKELFLQNVTIKKPPKRISHEKRQAKNVDEIDTKTTKIICLIEKSHDLECFQEKTIKVID
jgi:hypothetical protein